MKFNTITVTLESGVPGWRIDLITSAISLIQGVLSVREHRATIGREKIKPTPKSPVQNLPTDTAAILAWCRSEILDR